MLGINDPDIIIAYMLGICCLIFAIWFGISQWNKEDKK